MMEERERLLPRDLMIRSEKLKGDSPVPCESRSLEGEIRVHFSALPKDKNPGWGRSHILWFCIIFFFLFLFNLILNKKFTNILIQFLS